MVTCSISLSEPFCICFTISQKLLICSLMFIFPKISTRGSIIFCQATVRNVCVVNKDINVNFRSLYDILFLHRNNMYLCKLQRQINVRLQVMPVRNFVRLNPLDCCFTLIGSHQRVIQSWQISNQQIQQTRLCDFLHMQASVISTLELVWICIYV